MNRIALRVSRTLVASMRATPAIMAAPHHTSQQQRRSFTVNTALHFGSNNKVGNQSVDCIPWRIMMYKFIFIIFIFIRNE